MAGRRGSRRRWLLPGLMLVAVALAGYFASLLLYPAPIVARDHRIPLVVGMPGDDAAATLERLGFRVKVGEARESDPLLPAGHVAWQDPPAWLDAPEGSLVELTLSAGPAPVAVPDVYLFDLDEARRILGAAGLGVGSLDSVAAEAPPGVVVATRPAEGTPRPPGSVVDVVVSRGPAAVRVPVVTGLPVAEARRRLEAAGFRPGMVRRRPDARVGAGLVLDQQPRGGVFLPRGGRVDLTVAEARP
jgi:beta-lactam-binding protein with PASTA domain